VVIMPRVTLSLALLSDRLVLNLKSRMSDND
jgi:hypothetical protein